MRVETVENRQMTERKDGIEIMMRLQEQLGRVFIEASKILIYIFSA
jgi:hypothetical protein